MAVDRKRNVEYRRFKLGRYLGPACRLCRTEGMKLYLKGDRCNSRQCAIERGKGQPGKNSRDRVKKLSDFGVQLRAKQRVKRTYGMFEKQFRGFFSNATRQQGVTGDNLIKILETRLDNIVYRMHFAASRNQARQLVSHGHILVNGKRVSIPSYLVRANDSIEVHESSKRMTVIKDSLKEYSRSGVVPWLEVDPDALVGAVKAIPERSDVQDLRELVGISEQLIVELYSK